MEDNDENKTELGCPGCGVTDQLSTIEELFGYAGCTLVRREDGVVEVDFEGYTDVDYGSSSTVGLHCGACEGDWYLAELDAKDFDELLDILAGRQ